MRRIHRGRDEPSRQRIHHDMAVRNAHRVAPLWLALFFVMVAATPPAGAQASADAVIAFVDSGINPYHASFRDDSPRAYQHPSTYLEGYPADAVALPITLDEPDWAKAVQADCELWRSVEPGTLYWFP